MLALADTQVSPRAAAIAMCKLLHPYAACNPATLKVCTQHHNERPGVFGDWQGANSYAVHVVKGTLGKWIDCDDPGFTAQLLSTLPRLTDGYIQHRGDHAAFFVVLAYALPNHSLNTAGNEIASLRGAGLYQIGAGSVHPSGDLYIGNGQKPITLTREETDALSRLFNVHDHEPPRTPAARPIINPFNDTPDDDYQTAKLALAALDPDMPHDDWKRIGMGLVDGLGQAGAELWDQWSAQGRKYLAGEPLRKAATFKPSGNGRGRKVTLPFVFKIADRVAPGWRPTRKSENFSQVQTAPSSLTRQTETAPAVDIIDNVLATASAAQLPASLPYTYRAELKNLSLRSLGAYLDCGYEATAQGLADAGENLPAAQWADVFRQTGREVNEKMIRRAGKRLGADFLPHGNTYKLSTTVSNRSKVDESLDCAEKRPHRPPVLIGLPTIAQIEAGILRLSIPRIFDQVFGPDEETIEPIKAELIAALPLDLTADEISAAFDTLTARYGALISAQPDLEAKLESARNLYRALQRRLKDMSTAPLPTGWKCRNEAEYVQTYAKGWHNAQGGDTELSQEKLASALGGSPKRANKLLNRAAVRTEKRTTLKPIESASELRSARQWDNNLQGFAKRVVASKDGKTWHSIRVDDKPIPLTSPELPAMVASARASGLQVAIEYQQTNRQVSVSAVQPERKPREKGLRELVPEATPATLPEKSDKPAPANPRRQFIGAHRDPAVAVSWLCKLLAFGTPWQRRDDSLINRETGEITPYTVRTAFDLALGKELPMYNHDKTEDRAVRHAAAQPDHPAIQSEAEPEQPRPLRENEYRDEYGFLHTTDLIEATKGAKWCTPRATVLTLRNEVAHEARS